MKNKTQTPKEEKAAVVRALENLLNSNFVIIPCLDERYLVAARDPKSSRLFHIASKKEKPMFHYSPKTKSRYSVTDMWHYEERTVIELSGRNKNVYHIHENAKLFPGDVNPILISARDYFKKHEVVVQQFGKNKGRQKQ